MRLVNAALGSAAAAESSFLLQWCRRILQHLDDTKRGRPDLFSSVYRSALVCALVVCGCGCACGR